MRRIISCYFTGAGSSDRWPRLARVFAHSARTHCPTWQLSLAMLPPPRLAFNESANHSANTRKLEHWCDAIANASDGDEVLLIDADTFIVRSINDIWEQPFDVAYTVRPDDYPHPLNGGVVFIRVSPTTRLFMGQWRIINQAMRKDRELLYRWRRYQGINQRALGQLLEERGEALGHILRLPCAEWNCEDSAWRSFDPAMTRIVHVKSALRDAVFHSPTPPAAKTHLRSLARIWLALERDASALPSPSLTGTARA